MINPTIILTIIFLYFSALLLISYVTSKNSNNQGYYLGNKQSPWLVVAFGLIGDSLSGVTFVSVPGQVGVGNFAYMQMVLGYVLGYLVIAKILLPLYYKWNLVSIYTFLGDRLGTNAQKTGSFFFLLSRTIGAAFRLYIALIVLEVFIFEPMNISFHAATIAVILLILAYTIKGGIKTLVWTDMLQSIILLSGLIFSIYAVADQLGMGFGQMVDAVAQSDYSKTFFFSDAKAGNYFFKQFFGGMFIAIAMTGLDQNMMQKNLSIKTLGEAQKNIYWFSIVVVFINLLFVSLGALLYLYASQLNIAIPAKTDYLFPQLALNNLGLAAAIMFVLGITAATFSSADSVLTTLTTSFIIDILGIKDENSNNSLKTKNWVHFGFSILLFLVIALFRAIQNDAIINSVFKVANYTYGPLLGLFAFGIFTQLKPHNKLVPLVCILAPAMCYVLDSNAHNWIGYKFGNELLLLNGALTFAGLYFSSKLKSA